MALPRTDRDLTMMQLALRGAPVMPRLGAILVQGNPTRLSTFDWVGRPKMESTLEGDGVHTTVTWTTRRRVIYPESMTSIIPADDIPTAEDLPDSEELAAAYEARALAMEQEAADAKTPAQQTGHRLGASSFRRKAAEIRRRLGR